MLSDHRLAGVAAALAEVDGVVGVSLGGSRARGTQAPDSDVDLGLYYRPPLDTRALRALARELTGREVEVTEPGGWGPWVDGGAWLRVDGTAVDWLYRDLERVRASWLGARRGEFEFHFQVGHPLGVASFAYAGEIALARVLADPGGELTALHRDTHEYPAALAGAVVERLWEADFILGAAKKVTARGDSAYLAGVLFRAVGLCAHAIHARAGRWLINEKGAVAAAGRLPGAPPDFVRRVDAILAAVTGDPSTALALAADLVAELR